MANEKEAATPREFGLKDRLVLTMLMDTQPKYREKYLNKFGYELNPKDDNLYKKIGSDEPWSPIDPGGYFDLKQYVKGGAKEGAKEAGLDVVEGVLDSLSGSVLEGAGFSAGALATLATANPAAGVAARSVGRGVAFAGLEKIKDKLAELIIEEDLQPDDALRATQATLASLGPEVIGKALKSGAVKGAVNIPKKVLEGASRGVRTLLKIGNGKVPDYAWKRVIQNPKILDNQEQMMTASQEISDVVRNLRGDIDGEIGNIQKSAFRKVLTDAEDIKKAAIRRLTENADISVDVKPLKAALQKEERKLLDLPTLSDDAKGKLSWLKEKISDLKRFTDESETEEVIPDYFLTGARIKKINKTIPDALSFESADNILTQMQRDANTPRHVAKSFSPLIEQFGDALKNKAVSNGGTDYGTAKSMQRAAYKIHDELLSTLKERDAIQLVFNAEPRGMASDAVSTRAMETLKKVDGLLGSNISEQLDTSQIQNRFWNQISQMGQRGSGGVNTASRLITPVTTAAGGLIGRSIGGTTGATAGMAVGGGIGHAASTLADPNLGVKTAIGLQRASQNPALNQAIGFAEGAIDTASEMVPDLVKDAARAGISYQGVGLPSGSRVKPPTPEELEILRSQGLLIEEALPQEAQGAAAPAPKKQVAPMTPEEIAAAREAGLLIE